MTTRHRVLAAGAALCLTGVLATSACSTPHHTVVAVPVAPAAASYSLAAYGENGHCYYIDDPAEVVSLQQAGLCPSTWTAMIMPLLWHETYYDYYASPAYYNTYVPVRYRTVWVSQSTSFYNTNKTTILVVHTKGTYKDSTGKTVPAAQIPSAKMTFAAPTLPGGNRTAPTLPAGNARVTSAPKPVASNIPLPGGNARSSVPAPVRRSH